MRRRARFPLTLVLLVAAVSIPCTVRAQNDEPSKEAEARAAAEPYADPRQAGQEEAKAAKAADRDTVKQADEAARRPTLQELVTRDAELRPVAQLPARERVQPLLDSAADVASRGDLDDAVARYDLAVESARESGDTHLEVEASLRYAGFLVRQAKRVPAPAEEATGWDRPMASAVAPTAVEETRLLAKERQASEYAAAVRLYTQAADSGSPQQSALARNELGNLHLAMGDYAAAADTFRHLDLASVPEGQRFVYQFNRGRALELAGDDAAAWSDYLAALRAQPAFRPAVTAAVQGLERDGTAERAAELAALLLDRQQIGAAEEVLWPALERWPQPTLFALLGRAWAADLPDPGEGATDGLASSLRRRLAAVAGDDRTARQLAGTLSLAFDSEIFDRLAREAVQAGADPLVELSRKIGDPWREAGVGAALSELLTSLAARDRRAGRAPAALARTFVAWWIDDHNTQAAADCAAVLLRHPDLDPEGRVMEKLIAEVFVTKGAAYAAGDWRNILRMHLLLASIYEERGEWGSEGDPRGAVFQLSHALRAEKLVRELDPSYTPSPGLHRRLGDAYAALGRQAAEKGEAERAADRADRAVGHYLQAAASLSERGRLDDARRQLETASGLGLPTSATSRERLADARRRLEIRYAAAAEESAEPYKPKV